MTTPAPEEPIDEQKVLPLLLQLVECLCAQLDLSVGGAPCFCGVVPGINVAADYCDCTSKGPCGKAYVNLMSLYPSNVFPTPLRDAGNCGAKLAARVRMGTLRCMPTFATPAAFGKGAGEPATIQQQLDSVRVQLSDMQHMRKAIECCANTEVAGRKRKLLLDTYTPVGPQGNCGGGEWTFWVSV